MNREPARPEAWAAPSLPSGEAAGGDERCQFSQNIAFLTSVLERCDGRRPMGIVRIPPLQNGYSAMIEVDVSTKVKMRHFHRRRTITPNSH
jgi:hypothetical protein